MSWWDTMKYLILQPLDVHHTNFQHNLYDVKRLCSISALGAAYLPLQQGYCQGHVWKVYICRVCLVEKIVQHIILVRVSKTLGEKHVSSTLQSGAVCTGVGQEEPTFVHTGTPLQTMQHSPCVNWAQLQFPVNIVSYNAWGVQVRHSNHKNFSYCPGI